MIYSNERGSVIDNQITLKESENRMFWLTMDWLDYTLWYESISFEEYLNIRVLNNKIHSKSKLGVSIIRPSKINIGNKNG